MEVRKIDRVKVEAKRVDDSARSSRRTAREDAPVERMEEAPKPEPNRKADSTFRKPRNEEIYNRKRDDAVKEMKTASAKKAEREMVDLSEKAKKAELEASVKLEPAGTYNDYTVNSDNEVIVKVRNRETGSQVKQIPSEEYVSAKRAFRQMVEKIFDTKI